MKLVHFDDEKCVNTFFQTEKILTSGKYRWDIAVQFYTVVEGQMTVEQAVAKLEPNAQPNDYIIHVRNMHGQEVVFPLYAVRNLPKTFVFNGNHFVNSEPQQGSVTVVQFGPDRDTPSLAKVLRESELSFKPEWVGFTLRGYGKKAPVPDNAGIDMSDAKPCYVGFYSENGQFVLYDTKEERDANHDAEAGE